jgi:signal transduction histidine kinase
VARDSEQLDRRLSRLRLILFVPTLGVVVLAAAVVSLTIRRSLRHVERLSASIASIDATSLRERLLLHGLPDELKPPFVKLNELLSRIEGSLARERQFNADVSHELRTPLAGLRTILEVSASRERSAADYRAGLTEALEVVGQVEAIVENLILLARLGSGQMTADSREEIRLGDLVRSCFAPYAETGQRRGLTFENRISPEVTLSSDRVKLRLVLTNLLSNAAEYTTEGGWIAVESDPTRGLVLAVRDSGPAIPEEAVARLFDPFFRLDSARSGNGEHYGIGLALVRGLCDTLGYRVSVQNEASGAVAFTVTRATDGR